MRNETPLWAIGILLTVACILILLLAKGCVAAGRTASPETATLTDAIDATADVDAQVAAVATARQTRDDVTSGRQSTTDGGVNIGAVQIGDGGLVALAALAVVGVVGITWLWRRQRADRRALTVLITDHDTVGLTDQRKTAIGHAAHAAGVATHLHQAVRAVRAMRRRT